MIPLNIRLTFFKQKFIDFKQRKNSKTTSKNNTFFLLYLVEIGAGAV